MAPVRRALLLAISGLVAFALYAGAQMRPLLGSLATTRVSNAVNRIVYQAVNEAIDSGQIACEQLVSYEKDNEGRITMVRSNMAAFNRLQSQILDLILGRMTDQVSARELSIPVGSLTGSPLLAGRGPRISVRMESIGISSARFETSSSPPGSTRPSTGSSCESTVYVSILLPGYSTVTQVTNEITVAETAIVGSVPGPIPILRRTRRLCRRRPRITYSTKTQRTLAISHGVCRLQGRTGLSAGLSYGTGVSLLCFRRPGDPGL